MRPLPLLTLAILCLLSTPLTAQSKVNFGRTGERNTATEPSPNMHREVTDHIFTTTPLPEDNEEIQERDLLRFADAAGRTSASLLSGGQVYTDWPELDDYVNAVLDKLVPAEFKDRPYLRAYVIKDPGANAFMTPSGQFFINIGLLAEFKDESSLAGVIAHELGHYTLQHGLEGFIRRESGEFDGGLFFSGRKAASQFSIANEEASDAIAKAYLSKAGYDIAGLLDVMEVLQRQTERALLTREDIWEIKATTHPTSADRIEKVNTGEGGLPGEGVTALVDGKAFDRFRQQAIYETLKYQMLGFNYQRCLEYAFRQHIYTPNDPTYIYYAMESIRRMGYLDTDFWNKKFLVDGYHDITEKNGIRKKVKITTHLFDQFRPALLALPDDSFKTIPAKFYWEGDPKFVTNEEAYAFFYRVGKLLKEPECLLSNALSLSFDPTKMRPLLEEYVASGDVRYKAFAQALLDDKIFDVLPDKKLTALTRFTPVIKQATEEIILPTATRYASARELVQAAVGTFEHRKFIDLSDLARTDNDTYFSLTGLQRLAFTRLVTKGEKPYLHILDPDFWRILQEYEANQVEFVVVSYEENISGKYTTEEYRAVLDSKLSDYLTSTEGKAKYANVYIGTARMKAEGEMKSRYYDGSSRLSSKKPAVESLREVLVDKLAAVDKAEK